MIKGRDLTLGGTTYVVPPLSLGAIERFQEALASTPTPSLIIDVATAALRRNYPDLTREIVADLIDVDNCAEVFDAIMSVSQMQGKAARPGGGRARARR